MRNIVQVSFCVGILLCTVSCSWFGKKPPLPAEWRYEKNAIVSHLKADPNLNLYEGNSHPLVACIYQLSDPNVFNQLRGDADGLAKLLECQRFDAGVVQFKRFPIQPGQEITESMDRAEGARYVGVVAGYFNLREERIVDLLPIPVVEQKTRAGVALKPTRFYFDVNLGPNAIQIPRGK